MWPGLGQLWLGQTVKGVVLAAGAPLVCCGLGLINLLAALGAFGLARKRSRGEAIGPYESTKLVDWLGEL